MPNEIAIRITGEAGQGTQTIGDALAHFTHHAILTTAMRRNLSKGHPLLLESFGRRLGEGGSLARFRVPPPRIVEKNRQRMPCQMELSFCQRLMNFLKPKANQEAHA